jgi:hypothetical protein
MTERQILRDTIRIGVIDFLACAKTTATLCVFGGEQMALAGAGAHDFAGAGDLEPFGHGLPSFITFGASHKFTFVTKERAI